MSWSLRRLTRPAPIRGAARLLVHLDRLAELGCAVAREVADGPTRSQATTGVERWLLGCSEPPRTTTCATVATTPTVGAGLRPEAWRGRSGLRPAERAGLSRVGASGSPGRLVVTQDEPVVSDVVAPEPTRPPPGLVDEALSLLIHAAWPLDPDRIHVLQSRLGLDGEGPTACAEAAGATGLSRSVVSKAEQRACELARRVGAPASLSAALRLLGSDIVSVGEAAARLHYAGLTRGVLHPATVLEAATWFGLPATAAMYRLPDGSGLVVPTGRLPAVSRAQRRIRAACHARGIVPFADLVTMAARDRELVGRLVVGDPRMRCLGDEVWLAPDRGRNVVSHSVRRMLAVGPHPVTELQAGVQAAMYGRPQQARPPSVEALAAYVAGQPEYLVRDGVARRRLRVAPEPARTDAAMVAAFRAARTREMTTAQLHDGLAAAGFSRPGFAHLLKTSPILQRVGYGRYRLRAARDAMRSGQ